MPRPMEGLHFNMVGVSHRITNHKDWNRAFNLYAKKAHKKTETEIINRAAGKATSRAMALTPRADIKARPLGKEYNPKIKSRWGTYQGRTWYAFMAKKGYRKGNIFDAANEEYNSRRGAKGAIAAGFINSIKAFGTGGKVRARGFGESKKRPGGSVAKSYGTKARGRRGKTKAVSHNSVAGSDPIALPAMKEGIREQIEDMRRWALGLQQKAARTFKQLKRR